MAETRLLGVAKIELGAIAADGDVSTSFASPGNIYKDTAEITQEQEADTEHFCEEQDEAFAIVPGSKKTKIKLKTVEKEFVSWEDFQYICELKVENSKKK